MALYSMGNSTSGARRSNARVHHRTEVPIHCLTSKMDVPQTYLMNTLRNL